MTFALGPRAAAAGYRITSYDSIGSTNAEALECARAGDRGPIWIAARAQSAGRGRRGRDWSTSEGNLAASLLKVVDVPLARAATLGFVAGLALDEALRLCASGVRVGLKWPNDVLASGAKLAGILLESEPMEQGRVHEHELAVVIGIGVNVASAPSALPYPAISLAKLGFHVLPELLFAALTDAWIEFERIWDEGRGIATVRSLWLARAEGLNAPVAVRVGSNVIRGIFETLDDQGRLIVRAADHSLIPVAAGEVHFGLAATISGPVETC